MKRILMFGMSSYPGGIENFIKNYFLTPVFSKHFTIDFVTYEECLAYQDQIIESGHGILKVPHLRKRPFGYFKAISNIFKQGRYDGVYINMLSGANALPVLLAKNNHISQIVLHAHASGTVGLLRKVLHRLFRRYCSDAATLRLACGKDAGEFLFDGQGFSVVPNAIDSSLFLTDAHKRKITREKLGVSESEVLLGHVGRFAPEKNHTFILDVFQAYLESGTPAKLLLVGDGGIKSQIEQIVLQRGLTDSVIFYGTAAEPQVLYSAMDYFIFPSTFEGFGMSVLEAQAAGRKCFVSDKLPKAVNVTNTVEFLPLEQDTQVWVSAIHNAAYVDAISMNQSVAQSEFDISKQVIRLVNLLNEQF